MFREMIRFKQQMSEAKCIEVLKNEPRGVLSVLGDNDYPYGVPHNHYYCEEDGKIYFHSGMTGHKIDALRRHPKASYCVTDGGIRNDGEWFLRFQSVIVFGTIEFIEDREKIYDITRKLSRKFTQDEAYIENEILRAGPRTILFALVPEHISGKLVKES